MFPGTIHLNRTRASLNSIQMCDLFPSSLRFVFSVFRMENNQTQQAIENNVIYIILAYTYTHLHIWRGKQLCIALFHLTGWLSWHGNKLTHKHVYKAHTYTRAHSHIMTVLMMILNVSHTRSHLPHSLLLLPLSVFVFFPFKSVCGC